MKQLTNIKTKYPILFIHGIACRDADISHAQNCWGNIPEMLKKQGIQVFFANNDAWASIEDNAIIICETINTILETTHTSKVNIIAHSKGGLEARYVISLPQMANKIASLTTINTPHRGVTSVDLMLKILPERMSKWMGKTLSKRAKKDGDKKPDVLTCAKQLTSKYCAQFNQKIHNQPSVYYQSIHSYIRICSPLYWIPYFIGKLKGERMDGVISESSAKWGNFRKDIEIPHVNHSGIVDTKLHKKKHKAVLYMYLSLIITLASMGL